MRFLEIKGMDQSSLILASSGVCRPGHTGWMAKRSTDTTCSFEMMTFCIGQKAEFKGPGIERGIGDKPYGSKMDFLFESHNPEKPLSTCINLDDFAAAAYPKISERAIAYISSAAASLHSLHNNRTDWSKITRPGVITDVTNLDTSCRMLGQKSSCPSLSLRQVCWGGCGSQWHTLLCQYNVNNRVKEAEQHLGTVFPASCSFSKVNSA